VPSVLPLPLESPVVVRRIDDPELLEAVFRLRVSVWAAQGVQFDSAQDGRFYEATDAGAEHYGIVQEGALVAAVRLSLHESIVSVPLPPPFNAAEGIVGPIAFLSRLVVRPDARHRGYGSLLTEHRIHRARELGASTLLAFTTVPSRARHLRELGFAEHATAIVMWGQRAEHGTLLVRTL
jgi:GNAT superfamily N-acetyltransferase